jgi:hypothetical protein
MHRERAGATSQLEALRQENERLRQAENDIPRLRGEVTLLRAERDDLLRRLTAAAPKNNPTNSAPVLRDEVDGTWVQQVLNGPPMDQGMAAGALRGKMLRGEMTNISPSELALQKALLQRQLNQTFEGSPRDFADFQTAFIQSALEIDDVAKVQQIHDLILRTYERAVSAGLDIPSKPPIDPEAWVQRRFQLDRRATAAVKDLFTPEERRIFDRAFLGVMGVDLGGVGVDKSNYPPGFLPPE